MTACQVAGRVLSTSVAKSRASSSPLSQFCDFLLLPRWLESLQPPLLIISFSKECTGYGKLGPLSISFPQHALRYLRLAVNQARLPQKRSARVLRFQVHECAK